jgi:DNA-binding beta-propeller fold protein YncE
LFLPSGDTLVTDFNNHRIRRIAPDGIVTTVSGSGWLGDGPPGVSACWFGCDLEKSDWWHPSQMFLDPHTPDVFWAASWHNHRIVRVDLLNHSMEWATGAGEPGYRNGEPEQVLLAFPSSVVVARDGTQYVSDQGTHTIRKILPDGVVEHFAGTAGEPGYDGDGGPAAEARLHSTAFWVGAPSARLLLDEDEGVLYVVDTLNSIVRVIDLDTGVIDRFAGKFVSNGTSFMVNELNGTIYESAPEGRPGHAGDGKDRLEARLGWPRDIAPGPSGDFFIADSSNHCVRRIDADGIVSTVAGECGDDGLYGGDGGPAVEAQFNLPVGLALDTRGDLYVADANNHVIRRVKRNW